MWLNWTATHDAGQDNSLQLELVWEDKAPSRLREAIFLEFRPRLSGPSANETRLYAKKMGSLVDTSDVVKKGKLGWPSAVISL